MHTWRAVHHRVMWTFVRLFQHYKNTLVLDRGQGLHLEPGVIDSCVESKVILQ